MSKKLSKLHDNSFSDVSAADAARSSDDPDERSEAESVHHREMRHRSVAAGEGGGPWPKHLLSRFLTASPRTPR